MILSAEPQIRCVNFYGLETERMNFVCDWVNHPHYFVDKLIEDIDLTTFRVPFSHDFLKEGNLTILDEFVFMCDKHNLSIILDWHRTHKTHQGYGPLQEVSLSEFISTWLWLLHRYNESRSVQGVGIFNEYQGSATAAVLEYSVPLIQEIEAMFPRRFYYFVGCPGWGGDCSSMGVLLTLDEWERTFVEVHKYIFSGTDWDQSIPVEIPATHWFVGETGWKQDQQAWGDRFFDYLKKRNITNVCFWTIAHSGDTEGLWNDDCHNIYPKKLDTLRRFWNISSPGALPANDTL